MHVQEQVFLRCFTTPGGAHDGVHPGPHDATATNKILNVQKHEIAQTDIVTLKELICIGFG